MHDWRQFFGWRYAIVLLTVVSTTAIGSGDVSAQPNNRKPMPSQEKQKELRGQLRKTYAADYTKATKPAEMLAFAQKLAQASSSKDPDTQFEMIREACRLTIKADRWDELMKMVNLLGKSHSIDGAKMKSRFVENALKDANPTDAISLSEKLSQSADKSKTAKQWLVAGDLSRLSLVAAEISKNTKAIDSAKQANALMQSYAKLKTDAVAAERTLESTSSDKPSCLVWGRYHCILNENWALGLRYAANSQGPWQTLSTADLKSDPSDTKAVSQIAEQWYTASEQAQGIDKLAMRQRARLWFQNVIDNGKPAEVTKAKQRLALMERKASTSSKQTRSGLPAQVPTETKKTEVAGGPKGKPYKFRVAKGDRLVGLRVSVNAPIKFICPIYDSAEGRKYGPIIGQEIPQYRDFIAPRGFVVGGLSIAYKEYVNAIQVSFRPARAGRGRWQHAPWFGQRDGKEQVKSLGDPNMEVIGIFGKADVLIDSIGLELGSVAK